MCIYIHTHICTRMHMHSNTHAHSWHHQTPWSTATETQHLYAQMCIHIHVHMYIHVYVYIYIYTCIHVHILLLRDMSVHIHTYTYIHTHIQHVHMHARKKFFFHIHHITFLICIIYIISYTTSYHIQQVIYHTIYTMVWRGRGVKKSWQSCWDVVASAFAWQLGTRRCWMIWDWCDIVRSGQFMHRLQTVRGRRKEGGVSKSGSLHVMHPCCRSGLSFHVLIAFTTWNSNLIPLFESLCSSNPCRFEFSVFWVFAGNKWRPRNGQSRALTTWASFT